MIELFLNEKSLQGQFTSVDDFCNTGLLDVIKILEEQKNLPHPVILYKSENIADAKITDRETYAEVVFDEHNRIYDEIRLYKRELTYLIDEPYWNSDCKQNPRDNYLSTDDGMSLNNTSVAEAECRDGILISFPHQHYQKNKICLKKNSENVYVYNIWKEGQLVEATYQKRKITFMQYSIIRWGNQKLNFSLAKEDNVWNRIPKQIENSVTDAFEKFCNTPWVDIPSDKGLGYKPYHKSNKNHRFFSTENWKKGIKEFRCSDKTRCFGYQDKGRFYILLIDTEYKLGNL